VVRRCFNPKGQNTHTPIRPLLSVLAALSWTCGLVYAADKPDEKPNIVFIMADDVSWSDFQCYNPQGKIPSPNIDRLAREGMRFTGAHTPAALCAPARYTVATGNQVIGTHDIVPTFVEFSPGGATRCGVPRACHSYVRSMSRDQGELRIYTTTIPATTRRTCLMQDRLYRLYAATNSMGYNMPPQHSNP